MRNSHYCFPYLLHSQISALLPQYLSHKFFRANSLDLSLNCESVTWIIPKHIHRGLYRLMRCRIFFEAEIKWGRPAAQPRRDANKVVLFARAKELGESRVAEP